MWNSEEQQRNLRKLFIRYGCQEHLPMDIRNKDAFYNMTDLYGVTDKFEGFAKLIMSNFDAMDKYYIYHDSIMNKLIEAIKESEVYKAMSADTSLSFPELKKTMAQQFFKEENVGGTFLSIDIKESNYSSLVHYANEHSLKMPGNAPVIYGWKNFVSMYTDFEFLINSKFLRTVAMGKINFNSIIKYMYSAICSIAETLNKRMRNTEGFDLMQRAICLNKDEIIFNMGGIDTETVGKIISNVNSIEALNRTVPLRTQYFKLGRALETDGYIKKIAKDIGYTDIWSDENTTLKIKCASLNNNLFIMRKLRGEDITEQDKMFVYNGKLAKLIEYPDVEITYSKIGGI